jgi:hypothetical protein
MFSNDETEVDTFLCITLHSNYQTDRMEETEESRRVYARLLNTVESREVKLTHSLRQSMSSYGCTLVG